MRKKIQDNALKMLKGYSPAKSRDIKAYARMYCNEVIDFLYDIVADEENFPRDRIQAGEAILNRAYGKPGNAADEDDFTDAINVERLTTQQLTKMLAEIEPPKSESTELMVIDGTIDAGT